MAEEKVGLIPDVMIEYPFGLGWYGLLFTSERCIFFPSKGGGSVLGRRDSPDKIGRRVIARKMGRGSAEHNRGGVHELPLGD